LCALEDARPECSSHKRSASCSMPQTGSVAADMFAAETQYVAALQDRAQSILSNTGTISSDDAGFIITSVMEVHPEGHDDTDPNRRSLRHHQLRSDGSDKFSEKRSDDSETRSDGSQPRSDGSESRFDGSILGGELSDERTMLSAGRLPGFTHMPHVQPKSKGSIGHPHLCCRPCLFSVQGSCESGDNCNFCHLPHHKSFTLDKRTRFRLRSLTYPECSALIIPLLQTKAQECGFEHHALDLINALMPSEASRVPSNTNTLPGLSSILKVLSFRQLLSLLVKSDVGGVHLRYTDTKGMLDKLRADIENRHF